jgi:hypothetical protein
MTGLSFVRTLSHDVVCLAWRHGGGGQPTERWQDKSRSLRPGWPAADGRKISNLARCSLLHDDVHLRNSPTTTGLTAPRISAAS